MARRRRRAQRAPRLRRIRAAMLGTISLGALTISMMGNE